MSVTTTVTRPSLGGPLARFAISCTRRSAAGRQRMRLRADSAAKAARASRRRPTTTDSAMTKRRAQGASGSESMRCGRRW